MLEACRIGNLENLANLIDRGADISKCGDNLLWHAIYFKHFKIVKYLISRGVDIHSNDERAIVIGAEVGALNIIKYLVLAGGNVHHAAGIALAQAAVYDHLHVITYFASLGIDTTKYGNIAFLSALGAGNYRIVKYFLSHDISNIHSISNYYLERLIRGGHIKIIKYLVSLGIGDSLNASTILRTALSTPTTVWYVLHAWKKYEIIAYAMSLGAFSPKLTEAHRKYAAIYIRNQDMCSTETRAQKRIYFWWIQRCYQMTTPSGIRMAYRNLAEYEALYTS